MKIDRKPSRKQFEIIPHHAATLRRLVELHKAYSPQEALADRGFMQKNFSRRPKRDVA